MSEKCPTNCGNMSNTLSNIDRKMSETCLENVRNMYRKYPKHVREMLEQHQDIVPLLLPPFASFPLRLFGQGPPSLHGCSLNCGNGHFTFSSPRHRKQDRYDKTFQYNQQQQTQNTFLFTSNENYEGF